MYCLLTKSFPFRSSLHFHECFAEYHKESLSEFQQKINDADGNDVPTDHSEVNSTGVVTKQGETPTSSMQAEADTAKKTVRDLPQPRKEELANILREAKMRFKKEQQQDLFQ